MRYFITSIEILSGHLNDTYHSYTSTCAFTFANEIFLSMHNSTEHAPKRMYSTVLYVPLEETAALYAPRNP